MMRVLNELLFTPGVTAHREGRNMHFELRNNIAATKEVLEAENPAEVYEYAGFMYLIHKQDGKISMEPVPNQHPAASKEKHIRAAVEQYNQDHKQ
jgi:hypothetical protein